MPLRKTPILLSFVTTVAILFGGWFLYQQLEVKEPLKNEVAQMTSAGLADLDVMKNQINLKLTVTNPERFPQEYRALMEALEKRGQHKQLHVTFANQDEELHALWQDGQFAINEAIELHQYSKIPTILEGWKMAHGLEKAVAKMDDSSIYVYLKNGGHDFFTVIPRKTDTSEVTVHA